MNMNPIELTDDLWHDLIERTIAALQRANEGEDLTAATAITEAFLTELAT